MKCVLWSGPGFPSVSYDLPLARDFFPSGNSLTDEKESLQRLLIFPQESLAETRDAEIQIRRTIEGIVLDLCTRIEGLEL